MPDKASRYVTFKAPGTNIGDNGAVRVLLGDGGVRIIDGFGGWDVVSRPRKTAMTLWTGFQPLTLEIPVLFRTDSREWDDGKRIEGDCVALGMMAGRGEPSPEPQKRKGKVIYYTVKKGDTYAKIARATRVGLANLLQLNNIHDPAKIKRGQRIALPESSDKEPFGQPPVVEIDADGSLIPYNDLSWDDDALESKQWVIQNIEWEAGPEGSMRNLYGDRIRQAATVTVLQYVAPAVAATQAAPWRRTKRHTRGKSKTK
jgi:LysM repeat protein